MVSWTLTELTKRAIRKVFEVFTEPLFEGLSRSGLLAVEIGVLFRIVSHVVELIVIEVGRMGFGRQGAELAIVDVVRPWLGKFTGCVVAIYPFPSVAAVNLVVDLFGIAYLDVFVILGADRPGIPDLSE